MFRWSGQRELKEATRTTRTTTMARKTTINKELTSLQINYFASIPTRLTCSISAELSRGRIEGTFRFKKRYANSPTPCSRSSENFESGHNHVVVLQRTAKKI